MGLATAIFYDGVELDDTDSWSNYYKYFEVDLFEVSQPLEDKLESAKDLFKKRNVSGAINSHNDDIASNLGNTLFSESNLLKAQF